MRDVVLVSLYESGHQPLALASAAAFLRRAGVEARLVDLAVEPFERIGAPELVAISVPMHTALRLALPVLERLRDVPVACFGLYAPLHAAVLREAGARWILGAEAEEDLVALATGAPLVEKKLHRLPFLPPARDGLPALSSYARLLVGEERRVAGHVEATRGCKHMCRHCPIPPVYDGRFFAVPAEVVLADVRAQVAAGARHITFGDADFLNGPRHALAVARALHDEFPAVTWDATIKVSHILQHREVFAEFKALGCVFVVSAVESLSDRVLEVLDKGHTAADVRAALRIVRGAGISLRPTFVPFTPWTTIDDFRALVRFIGDEELVDEVDPVQLSLRLLVPPGSLLVPHMEPFLGDLDARGGTYVWTHPDPRMDELQERVAALVEDELDAAPAETFAAIAALAAVAPPRFAAKRTPPPRLSEPWFC